MGDDRPIVYKDTPTLIGQDEWEMRWVFRASSVGGTCTNAYLGYMLDFDASDAIPEAVQRGFDAGHEWEARLIERAMRMEHGERKYRFRLIDGEAVNGEAEMRQIRANHPEQMPGWCGLYGEDGDRQARVEVMVGERALIRCHLDGVAQLHTMTASDVEHLRPLSLGDRVVVEVKFFGADYWKKWKRDGIDGLPRYKTQVAIQQMGSGMPVLFVVGEKLTEGRGRDQVVTGIGEMDSVILWPDKVEHAKIKMRVMRVLGEYDKMVAAGVRGWDELPGCDVQMYPCPFFQYHGEEGGGVGIADDAEDLAGMVEFATSLELLNTKVGLWDENERVRANLSAAMKEADKTRDQLRDAIAELFTRLGRVGKKLKLGNGWKVEYVETEVPGGTFTRKTYTKRTVNVEKD